MQPHSLNWLTQTLEAIGLKNYLCSLRSCEMKNPSAWESMIFIVRQIHNSFQDSILGIRKTAHKRYETGQLV